MILPKIGEFAETCSDIAELTLSTPKKKKKWVLFEDYEHLQGGGVAGEHGGPVNHWSVGRDHVRKQVLQKYEGVDSERFGGLIDEENEEGSIQTSGAKLENLETNLGELKRQ